MDLSKVPLTGPRAFTRGYLVIHSAPSALCRHLEWAVANLLGHPVELTWRPQPLLLGTHRSTFEWRDRAGIGAEMASALRGWHYLRYEVREESADNCVLYRYTPNLGIHRAVLDGAGAVMITENQISNALALDDESLRTSLQQALGSEWDLELEQFRRVEMDEFSHGRAISF
ncbi:MAG: DUF3145 family protein [Actinobacteria bacterium]|nr:DUF3145 family protein [Actinomycetota bacterium]